LCYVLFSVCVLFYARCGPFAPAAGPKGPQRARRARSARKTEHRLKTAHNTSYKYES